LVARRQPLSADVVVFGKCQRSGRVFVLSSSSWAPSVEVKMTPGYTPASSTLVIFGKGRGSGRASALSSSSWAPSAEVKMMRGYTPAASAPTSSSSLASVEEVDTPPCRHRHLWRRPWAPGCTPAALTPSSSTSASVEGVAAIVVFGVVHGRLAARRQPSRRHRQLRQVSREWPQTYTWQPPRRHRRLWRRPLAPCCTPAS
jgi:hypothetical protein